MKSQHIAISIAAAAALVAVLAFVKTPAPTGSTTDAREDIEAIVHEYLMDNPDVLVAALTEYRKREETARQEQISQSITRFVGSIDDNPALPVVGSADASVTVVEFFDYRCGYCKQVFPAIKELMAEDGDIRLVYAEFPILGDASTFASRAAVAVWLNWPDRYERFHDMLMASRGQLDATTVMGTALELGIDLADLEAATKKPEVDAAIEANYELAQELGISGTPAFIIGDTLVPGAIELATFRQHIKDYRGS
ncbi:MAG: DsbA family protein [Rhodospirillales bacterium]